MAQDANNMSHRLNKNLLGVDLLADMIATTHTGGVLSSLSWHEPPWGSRFPATDHHGFHVVTQGPCWIRVAGEQAYTELGAGDVVLVGTAHELVSSPGAPVRDFDAEDPRALGVERAPGHTGILCGAYTFDATRSHPVFSHLPAMIHVAAGAREPEFDALVALLQVEFGRERPGSFTVTTRLIDAMLVYILRHFIERHCTRSAGWLGALRHPALARALDLIHKRPEHDWTIATLATASGTSRATLARRFQTQMGTSPIMYLTERRLELAHTLLETTDEGLAAIASRVGYADAFSLSKAFKRAYGMPPSQARAHLKASAPA